MTAPDPATEIIPQARIEALRRAYICAPASEWLEEPHTYKELVEQHPEWVVVAALHGASDVKALERATIAYGSDKLRRSFARNVPGIDKVKMLAGVAPGRVVEVVGA